MATTIESVAVVPGSLLHHSARKLADRAIEDALAAASIQPHDVDLLVNAGIFHDRILGEPTGDHRAEQHRRGHQQRQHRGEVERVRAEHVELGR